MARKGTTRSLRRRRTVFTVARESGLDSRDELETHRIAENKPMQESFIDFLEAYGADCKPSLVYGKGEDFGSWQKRFREKLEELRGPLVAPPASPEAEVLDTVVEEDHVRHILRIPTTRFSSMLAYVLVPADVAKGERRPGMLVLHGHAEFGIDSVCGLRGMQKDDNAKRAYALSAVRAGYVVLAPAWWGWHGRDGHAERVGNRDKCNVIQMAAGMYGLNVLSLHLQDAEAAMNVFVERPEVDPERIGCMGNSYGGRTAMWFTVFDERVKACVASGSMNVFRERSLKLSSCAIQYFPGLLAYGDVPEVFSLISPRPLQLQAGEKDGLITASDRDHIHETVHNAYRSLDAEDQYNYILHEEGHILIWEHAERFLQKHL